MDICHYWLGSGGVDERTREYFSETSKRCLSNCKMSHSLGGYWRPWLVSSLRARDGRCWLWTRMFMSVLGTWWGAQLRGLFLQQLVAWTAAAAVCKFAVNVGASLLRIDESPTTVFLDELWPYGVLLLISQLLFFGALILVVRFWGIRAWSVAVGVALSSSAITALYMVEAVLGGADFLSVRERLGESTLSGLVQGVMIYGGVYLEVAHRNDAGISDQH